MRKITEEDVIKFYMLHVAQICKNSYKGMEFEDRLMEAKIVILHAIRTYKTQYGCFEKYMLQQLSVIMDGKNKEAWAQRRLESIFSLDAIRLAEDGAGTYILSQCIGATLLDDTIFDVKRFMAGLPTLERDILFYLMEGYRISKLSNIFELSINEIQTIIEVLQDKASHYFE